MLFVASAKAEGTESTTKEAASAKADAKAHFERGLVLAQTTNDWDAALKEFVISRTTFPTKSATRNAAYALVQLGRNTEAFELYTQLLKEFSKDIEPSQLALDTAAARSAEQHTGLLEVRGNETEMSIVVDGVQRGMTPDAALIRLDEGVHTLRFSKKGFETLETQFNARGGERAVLNASIKQLRETGILVIREVNDDALDVVLDGAVVGKTPWSGSVSPGAHLVALRGQQMWGSKPSAASVTARLSTTLTLRAEQLDAELRVEPTPSSASVSIDGVAVGNGIWTGRVPSGTHWIEVDAPGHVRVGQETYAQKGARDVVYVTLQRDPVGMPKPARRPQVYLEAAAGLLLSHSLRGTADDSCGCTDRSRPFGGLAVGRFGYSILPSLGLELSVGYLAISEKMTRREVATGEPKAARPVNNYVATDYRDRTRLSGPLATIGASYRAFERTPVTARISGGLALLGSRTTNSGTFSPIGSSEEAPQKLGITELDQTVLTPFVSTELRMGYRFSKHLSADLGIALLALFPRRTPRTGANNLDQAGERSAGVPQNSRTFADVLRLPPETTAGVFLAIAPSAAARFDF